jgi:hypothetical protein
MIRYLCLVLLTKTKISAIIIDSLKESGGKRMRKYIQFCVLGAIFSLLSCSYGLERPQNITPDCEDGLPLSSGNKNNDSTFPIDGIDPPILLPTLPLPTDGNRPIAIKPIVPAINASIELSNLVQPYKTTSNAKVLGVVTITIEGVLFRLGQSLPAGWTFRGYSNVASVTSRQINVNEIRILSTGIATEPGIMTLELAFDNLIVATYLVSFE